MPKFTEAKSASQYQVRSQCSLNRCGPNQMFAGTTPRAGRIHAQSKYSQILSYCQAYILLLRSFLPFTRLTFIPGPKVTRNSANAEICPTEWHSEMTSKQRSRSFNLVPIDSQYTTCYRLSIVTFALGRTVTSQYIASQTDRQTDRHIYCRIYTTE